MSTGIASAASTQQPPGLVPVPGVLAGRPTRYVVSTKPQPPPTFQPTNSKPSIQPQYAAPVYYNDAGAFSQPLQTLGKGALVNITA